MSPTPEPAPASTKACTCDSDPAHCFAHAAPPDPLSVEARWLSEELGMHQFVNDRECDCGDWHAFKDAPTTFNDHVAAEIVARASSRGTPDEAAPAERLESSGGAGDG